MTTIHLTTFIAAPVERVFDLSRSISLYRISTRETGEKVIGGTVTGLINENDTIIWRARHLFKMRQFTSKTIAMKVPVSFVEEMINGDLKRYHHEHHFKGINNGTIMIDLVEFETPYGFIGRMMNKFYVKNYVENLLIKRNHVIKEYAETKKWKAILN